MRQLKTIDGKRDVPRWHELVQQHPRTPAAPAILEMCATYATGEPMDRVGYLQWIYKEYPRSEYAAQARYYEVLHGVHWENHERRAEMIQAFRRDFPNMTGHINALQRLDANIRNLNF